MSGADALGFVERHGVVLESAHHATIPSLADAIAGESIRGSWWSNPHGKAIFRLTRAVREADDVLVCRLVADKAQGHFAEARAILGGRPRGHLIAPRLMAGAYAELLRRMLAAGWAPPRARAS